MTTKRYVRECWRSSGEARVAYASHPRRVEPLLQGGAARGVEEGVKERLILATVCTLFWFAVFSVRSPLSESSVKDCKESSAEA